MTLDHMPPKQKKMKKSVKLNFSDFYFLFSAVDYAFPLRRSKNENLKNLIWPIFSFFSV